MSGGNGLQYTVLNGVSAVVNGLCTGNELHKIEGFIENLIAAREVRLLLEDKDVDEKNIQKLVENFNTLKLLLQVAEEEGSRNKWAFPVEEIFQSIRDLFDVAVEVKDFPEQFPFNLMLDIVALLTDFSLNCCHEDITKVANFYQYNLYMIKINHVEEGEDNKKITRELALRLQIITKMLNCFLGKENQIGILKEKIAEADVPGSLLDSTLFSRLVTRNSLPIATQTLLCIIPKFIKYSKSSEVLQSIWLEISEKLIDSSRSYLIMCHLLNLYFDESLSESDENLILNIFEDEKYWIWIQNGLIDNDPLIRKQALFLFKKSIEKINKNNYKIACCKRDELNISNFDKKLNEGILKLKNGMKNYMISNNKIFLVQNDSSNVMWWDPTLTEELFAIYLKIFAIIECLEETQSHIIKPIFEIIEEIIQNIVVPFKNGKFLNVSWTIVIFQRILSHDNLSIVKWGILKLLKIPLDVSPNEETTGLIVKLLVKSLTKTILFASDGETLSEDLKIYFQSGNKYFFKILIKEICGLTWSSEALHFVVSALATVKLSAWEEEEILMITKFVSTTATCYTYIKSGIHCNLLKSIINLTDATNIKLEVLSNLLRSLDLRRGTKIWNEIANWIEYCYSKRNAEEFILKFLPHETNKLDEKCIAKTVVILYDAHLFGIMKCCGETPSCEIINALTTLLASFKDIDKRLYTDQKIIDRNLSILHHILNENLNSENLEKTRLVEMMLNFFPDTVTFVQRRLKSHDTLADFYTSQLYLNIFENILKAHQLYNIDALIYVNNLHVEIVNGLGTENSPVQKYLEVKLLKLIMDYIYHDKMIPNLKSLQQHFKKFVNTPLAKSEKETKSTKDLQVLWGKINSEYLEAKWYILERLTNEVVIHVSKGSVNVGKFVTPFEIFSLATEAFEVGGYSVLFPVMSVLKDALPECEDATQLSKIINSMWSLILERKKSEEFWSLMEKFVDVTFQRELFAKAESLENSKALSMTKEDIYGILLEYSKKIFSESTNGLPNALLKHLQKIGVKYNPNPVFCYILASALLFGPVQRKDELLIIQICSHIESLNISPLANDWCNNGEIRARAVQMILTLDPKSECHRQFAVNLVSELQGIASDFSKNKNRYFGDSFVHRIKHRLLQSLLILEPYLPQENAENLARWLCNSMISENHQPSVRYQQEWLLVRILYKNPHLHSSFWNYFDEALEKRPGSLCSFISVGFHLCKILPDEKISSWIDRAMQQFLPYCMAQHFSVRLYSQVTLQKLWELAKQLNITDVVNKYQIVSSCLVRSIESGNAVKNCVKLQEDFYFTVFHPLEHFSLQTIYSDLPRLANIGSNEWISVELFKRCSVSESSNKIPLKCKNESLESFNFSKWELRATSEIPEVEDLGSAATGNNFQKKMIPVKSVEVDRDELFNFPAEISHRKETVKKDGLIVVASLIDRVPNLGGLARTCEVFGVSEYVLGSLKYIQDKQFQSLSVTAEKWISMTEVKPFYLTEYLIKMKQNGYTILGAEQTAKSQHLASVKFPKKSLLLLGNEKEGIPPELLPILDICIEIPQFGIVRSLNVHVTGALFIYEYAKQHLLQK